MNCDEFKNVVSGYMQHSLSDEMTYAVEEHLCVCNTCRKYLSQMMDQNGKNAPTAGDSSSYPKKIFKAVDYIVLFFSVVVLFFLLLLLMKG